MGITASYPVPMDWPEQTVKIVEEQISPKTVKVSYRVLDNAVKQMLVTIPKLNDGETARVVTVFAIDRHWIEGPQTTEELNKPKPSKELQRFLGPSPFIETSDAAIKKQAGELANEQLTAWEQTRSYFDGVRANVKYKFDEQIKPAKDALQAKQGDCEELSSLFIAFCRLNKIPARAVWVPGHTYPEFYLEDANGKGHWYPCQAAGEAADFGRMPEDRPVLQKGDNIKVPDEKTAQRYVKHTLRARNAPQPPEVKFILERVKE